MMKKVMLLLNLKIEGREFMSPTIDLIEESLLEKIKIIRVMINISSKNLLSR